MTADELTLTFLGIITLCVVLWTGGWLCHATWMILIKPLWEKETHKRRKQKSNKEE